MNLYSHWICIVSSLTAAHRFLGNVVSLCVSAPARICQSLHCRWAMDINDILESIVHIL